MITGKTLIDWGFEPGPWFGRAIEAANALVEADAPEVDVYQLVDSMKPVPPETIDYLTTSRPYARFIEPETEDEVINTQAVHRAMDELMRTPTIVRGAVMPDACPAGIIPVGGVVATRDAIHPGFHSADICCSMAISVFKRGDEPRHVLDVAQKVTHFGWGKRTKSDLIKPPAWIIDEFQHNPFLRQLEDVAHYHFATQGDGNHFLFVGHLESTGQLAMVTHHGSRGLGAQLYKRGMAAAQKHTRIVSPRTPPQAAWLDTTREEGIHYWNALRIVREWTKANHFGIHDAVAKKLGNKVVDQWWNEHNFVFLREDGLFYHAKGATPSYDGFALDDSGKTLIPMNMSEPILITKHVHNEEALGFAPHGAGRNMSRTQFLKTNQPEMPEGIDVRFYTGKPDPSELPSAYKSAASVIRQIEKFRLADVVDRVIPAGTIMAGDTAWKRK